MLDNPIIPPFFFSPLVEFLKHVNFHHKTDELHCLQLGRKTEVKGLYIDRDCRLLARARMLIKTWFKCHIKFKSDNASVQNAPTIHYMPCILSRQGKFKSSTNAFISFLLHLLLLYTKYCTLKKYITQHIQKVGLCHHNTNYKSQHLFYYFRLLSPS